MFCRETFQIHYCLEADVVLELVFRRRKPRQDFENLKCRAFSHLRKPEGRHADYCSLPLVKKDHVTIWGRGNLGSSYFQNGCRSCEYCNYSSSVMKAIIFLNTWSSSTPTSLNFWFIVQIVGCLFRKWIVCKGITSENIRRRIWLEHDDDSVYEENVEQEFDEDRTRSD